MGQECPPPEVYSNVIFTCMSPSAAVMLRASMRNMRVMSSAAVSMHFFASGVQVMVTDLTGAAMLTLASALALRTCSTTARVTVHRASCCGAGMLSISAREGQGLLCTEGFMSVSAAKAHCQISSVM